MVTTIIHIDQPALFRLVAEKIFDEVRQILKKKKYCVIGIPGGRAMPPLFAALKELPLPWNKIHFFMVDERLVSLTDPESNFTLARQYLFKDLLKQKKLLKQNIHPFIIQPQQKDYGIKEYEQIIKKFNGYDLIILSIGEDGHVAALYPHHHSIQDSSPYFLIMNDSPKPPAKRMTASKQLLSKAKTAFLFVVGEAKQQAYLTFLNHKKSIQDCPAKLVNQIPQVYVCTDLAAGKK